MKGGKPVSEHKALQILNAFDGERSKFRYWNDEFLNELAQVKPVYRQSFKFLNKKFETLDGVMPEEENEDILRILNCRLTADQYARASQERKQVDDAKGT